MHMVGHEHVSVDCHGVLRCRVEQAYAIEFVIVFGGEDRSAIIATLDGVQRLAGDVKAG